MKKAISRIQIYRSHAPHSNSTRPAYDGWFISWLQNGSSKREHYRTLTMVKHKRRELQALRDGIEYSRDKRKQEREELDAKVLEADDVVT